MITTDALHHTFFGSDADSNLHCVKFKADGGDFKLTCIYPDGSEKQVYRGNLFSVVGKYDAVIKVGDGAAIYWLDQFKDGSPVVDVPTPKEEAWERDIPPCDDEELNSLLIPWATLKDGIGPFKKCPMTRAMLKNIIDSCSNKEGWEDAVEVCKKELSESDAKWFLVEMQKGTDMPYFVESSIRNAKQARQLGFRTLKMPVFPYDMSRYNKKVGRQKFTYGQLYMAWYKATKEMLADRSDEARKYPFFCELRSGDVIERPLYDIKGIMRDFAELTETLDNRVFDIVWNDPWANQADTTGHGFFLVNGKPGKK